MQQVASIPGSGWWMSGAPPRWRTSTVAVLLVGCALLARLLLKAVLGNEAPYLPFVVAVIAAAWYGGRWSGGVATILGGVLGTVLFVEPENTFGIDDIHKPVWFLVFLGTGGLISGLCESLHAARRRAEDSLTKLVATNQEVQASEARLAGIVQSAMDGIVSIDERHRCVLFNPAAERLFGRSSAEMLGQPIDCLIPERHRQGHGELIRSFSRTGATSRRMGALGKVSGLRSSGEEFSIEASISMIETAGQTMFTAIIRDVTDRERSDQERQRLTEDLVLQRKAALNLAQDAEEGRQRAERAEQEVRHLNIALESRVRERTAQLETTNKELEAFSYSVSHDLRAPLRAIDGFSRILVEEHASQLPEEARHYLALVRQNTQQMGHLVDDLLAFSRLGRQAMSKRALNLDELVRPIVDELHLLHPDRTVEVHIGDLGTCQGDSALLRQVFFNLLDNAFKYTRGCPGARIEVACREDASEPGARVYFVKDNGVGFDMRYVHKLFGVFQRLHRAEDYEGTGVGLALVQRIVHRHGGRIWAEAAVDQGARFSFTLGGGAKND